MEIRKGDTVVILAGKDKGKRGAVEKVIRETQQVVVAQANIMKRHMKPSSKYPSGGIIEVSYPIHQSNVMVIDPDTDQAGRTSSQRQGKTATRVFKTKKAPKAKK